MTTEADFYDQAELWGQAPEPYQANTRQDLLDLLPPDAASVLDVGCGDGFITHALAACERVVGVDVSRSALRHVRVPAVLGVIGTLPFPSAAFDLVMANDTLEHIPTADYGAALAELRRVAARYLLIAVPFMENLPGAQTRCTRCGAVFHVNHHQRAYGTVELAQLFGPDWQPRAFVFSGATPSPIEQAQRGLAAYLGLPAGWERALCPACGARRTAIFLDAAQQAALNTLTWELRLETTTTMWPSRSECLVLFERRVGPRLAEAFSGLRVVARQEGAALVVSSTPVQQEQHLVLEAEAETLADPNRLRLEYELDGCLYRLPRPDRQGPRGVIVPVWFSPFLCQSLSPQAFAERLRPVWFVSAALRQAEHARDLQLQTQALRTELEQAQAKTQRHQAQLEAVQTQLTDQAAAWQQALTAQQALFEQFRVRLRRRAWRALAAAVGLGAVVVIWLAWLSGR